MTDFHLLSTEAELINDIRDIIYDPGMTSKERAEKILRYVRAHDRLWSAVTSGGEYHG